MNKVLMTALAALAVSAAPAFAADMPVKAMKAPAAAPSPWDVAFGLATTTDYELRGVSQSNHRPAQQGYFEVDYTVNDWLKFYGGVWGSSLWTGFANAEFDITNGFRLTFGNFGLDIGNIYYYYPGGLNYITAPNLANGSFDEVYFKPSYKFNDTVTVGGTFETGFNNFNSKTVSPNGGGALLNGHYIGDAKHWYASGNAVITLPQFMPAGWTVSFNPEVGYEYYSSGIQQNLGAQSDWFWDAGLDFVYKAMTIDLRYWGTNLKANPIGAGVAPGVNPQGSNQCGPGGQGAGGGANFCGNRFVATLKFDTTLSALK